MKSENFFICVFYTYIHTYIKICTFHVSALVIDTQREKKKVFKYPFVIIKNPSVLFLQKNSIIINKESNFRTFSRTLRTRTARIAKGSSEGKVVAQRQWLTLPVATIPADSGRLQTAESATHHSCRHRKLYRLTGLSRGRLFHWRQNLSPA